MAASDREILDRLPAAAYVLDASDGGAVRYVSPQIEALLGFPAEEFVGTRLFNERVHPDDRPRMWHAMQERFEGQVRPWEHQYRLLTRDGRVIWVLDRDTGAIGSDGDERLVAGAIVDVTVLKEAEEQVELRNRQVEEIVARLGDGLLVLGADGRIVLANDTAATLLGVSRETLLGATAGETPTGSRLEDGTPITRASSLARRVLETGDEVRDVTYCFTPPDREPVWVSATIVPLVAEGETRPHGVVCSFHEITKRRQFAAALEESEGRFRQLAENLDAVFWMRDVDTGEVLYVSPAYEKIWGRPVQAVYEDRTAWLEAIHPDDREKVLSAVSGPDAVYNGTYRIVRPDGAIRFLRDRGSPIRDDAGRTYRIAGLAEDVTEQQATAAALREARELAHAAFEHAATGNVVFSIRSGEGARPLQANSAFCDLIGWSEGELHGKDVNSLMHPDDLAAEWSDSWHRLIGGEIQTYQVERRLIHRDGHVIWALLALSVIRDEHDEPVYGICQVQDISARKRGEAQQEAVARLGQHALAGAATSDLMDEAVQVVADTLDVDFAAILEDVPIEDELVVRAAAGGPPDVVGKRVPRATALSGRTLRARGPIVVDDWDREAAKHGSPVLEAYGPRSSMTVVVGEPESPWGVLAAHDLDQRAFRPDEINFLQAVANVLATAIHRWSVEEEARERALHDPLTGLPNRTLFHDRLEHAIARSERRPGAVAVMLVDLDHFKVVNESLGHDAGDELLRAVAPRLRQALPLTNTVA
ncbi:MAG: PAS domain S-box protein, partial [Thermoleophilaceae bacterium]